MKEIRPENQQGIYFGETVCLYEVWARKGKIKRAARRTETHRTWQGTGEHFFPPQNQMTYAGFPIRQTTRSSSERFSFLTWENETCVHGKMNSGEENRRTRDKHDNKQRKKRARYTFVGRIRTHSSAWRLRFLLRGADLQHRFRGVR